MRPVSINGTRRVRGAVPVCVLTALLLALASLTVDAQAPTTGAAPGRISVTPSPPHAVKEEGVRWQKLKPAQREALKPLQQEWAGIDGWRKQKWIQLADRMPKMPPEERERVQARMSDWARLTPTERGQARLRYEEARQIPVPDRRSRWEEYQALTPEQKRELASRAAAARGQDLPEDAGSGSSSGNGQSPHGDRSAREAALGKSNIVPNPVYSAPPRPVGPTTVQAAPGATTTPVTRRPTPPPHQHTGLPKIAATPEFVNKSTLLPQRGPQAAAIRVPVPGNAGSGPHR